MGKRRLAGLLTINKKCDEHCAEIELLTSVIERLEKLGRQEEKSKGTAEKSNREKGRPKKKASNDFTGIDADDLMKRFRESQFDYQYAQYQHIKCRIRNLLKARQIGFTRYFSAEALVDAISTGSNQIFLSASKNQASVFRDYIKGFVLEWFDKDLKGRDRIDIHTDAGLTTLHFLSANSCTAQSYHGNLYFDEYFWTRDFEKLDKVSKAMASQKRWRRTCFSTPSAISHPAYGIWNGEPFKEKFRRRNQAVPEFPNETQLRNGIICPDKQFR